MLAGLGLGYPEIQGLMIHGIKQETVPIGVFEGETSTQLVFLFAVLRQVKLHCSPTNGNASEELRTKLMVPIFGKTQLITLKMKAGFCLRDLPVRHHAPNNRIDPVKHNSFFAPVWEGTSPIHTNRIRNNPPLTVLEGSGRIGIHRNRCTHRWA